LTEGSRAVGLGSVKGGSGMDDDVEVGAVFKALVGFEVAEGN
jgi:hypothetical protein